MTTKLYSYLDGINILLKQLWLSISSVDFYQDVYKVYSGYGIRYLFTLSFIAATLYCSILLNIIINFNEDFKQDRKSSHYAANLNYIIGQLPDLKYDGNKINTEEIPFFLYTDKKGKIVAIDAQNKLDYNQKIKIPIIFTKDKLLVSFLWDKSKINFPIEYRMLFGTEPRILTKEIVKERINSLLDEVEHLIIYVAAPVLVLFILLAALLRACLLIFIVYMGTQLIGLPTKAKICIRLALFASGAHTFITPLINIVIPALNDMTWIALMLPSTLLFLSILKIKRAKELSASK
ncbi:MAG: DUF1189 domain-containing protein [Rickettsiaceae bacterium]|nr:MAG: DUF1189 domain-containing protein [Rickettsiaceae bacterium]